MRYNIYNKRVLKNINDDVRITKDSLELLNKLIEYLLIKLTRTANKFSCVKKTLMTRDISKAMCVLYSGELKDKTNKHSERSVKVYSTYTDNSSDKRVRKEVKAGLVFSVSKIESEMLKYSIFTRRQDTTGIIMTSIIEYTIAEILRVSITKLNKKTITANHIRNVLSNDLELRNLFIDFY